MGIRARVANGIAAVGVVAGLAVGTAGVVSLQHEPAPAVVTADTLHLPPAPPVAPAAGRQGLPKGSDPLGFSRRASGATPRPRPSSLRPRCRSSRAREARAPGRARHRGLRADPVEPFRRP